MFPLFALRHQQDPNVGSEPKDKEKDKDSQTSSAQSQQLVEGDAAADAAALAAAAPPSVPEAPPPPTKMPLSEIRQKVSGNADVGAPVVASFQKHLEAFIFDTVLLGVQTSFSIQQKPVRKANKKKPASAAGAVADESDKEKEKDSAAQDDTKVEVDASFCDIGLGKIIAEVTPDNITGRAELRVSEADRRAN